MRVAVYFSGRVRGCESCLDAFCEKFLDNYDVDVFVSLDQRYDPHEVPDASVAYLIKRLGDRVKMLDMRVYDDLHDLDVRMRALGSSRDALKTCPEIGAKGTAFHARIVHNTCSQMFHNRACTSFALRYSASRGFQYDAICKMRADLVLHEPLVLPSVILPGTLYVPEGCDHRGLNDQLAFGGPTAMYVYGSLYDAFVDYMVRDGAPLNAELMLGLHVARCGLDVARFNLKWELSNIRHDPRHEVELEELRAAGAP
jgi:hypothetical protein